MRRRIGPTIAAAAAAALLAGAAQATPSLERTADLAYERALALLSQDRPSAAYGRLIELANAGHAASARLALAMCVHGPEVWGRDWDCTADDLAQWARVGGVPTPALEARRYGADGRPRLSRMGTAR